MSWSRSKPDGLSGLCLPKSLVAAVEERAVLAVVHLGNPYGAAAGNSKLILMKWVHGGQKEVSRVEIGVPQELPQASMEMPLRWKMMQ